MEVANGGYLQHGKYLPLITDSEVKNWIIVLVCTKYDTKPVD